MNVKNQWVVNFVINILQKKNLYEIFSFYWKSTTLNLKTISN